MKTQIIRSNDDLIEDDTEMIMIKGENIILKNLSQIKIIKNHWFHHCYVVNLTNLYYIEGGNFTLENIHNLKSLQIYQTIIINCSFIKAYHIHIRNCDGKIFLPNNNRFRYYLSSCEIGNNLKSRKGIMHFCKIKQLKFNKTKDSPLVGFDNYSGCETYLKDKSYNYTRQRENKYLKFLHILCL